MKLFEYKDSYKLLENASRLLPQESDKPKMIVFAGPNASGKSTLIANLYKDGKITVPYINADVFNKTIFYDVIDENKRNEKAMFYTIELVDDFISKKQSFCYETVMSHPSKLELIKKAILNGYTIESTFVYTDSPYINLKRLNARVLSGGHNVPFDKLVARYYRSIENSKQLKSISDNYTEFNNSTDLEYYVETGENINNSTSK